MNKTLFVANTDPNTDKNFLRKIEIGIENKKHFGRIGKRRRRRECFGNEIV
jgi:hypothetical protein